MKLRRKVRRNRKRSDVYTAAEREKIFRADQRKAIRGLVADVKKAKGSKSAALAEARETCRALRKDHQSAVATGRVIARERAAAEREQITAACRVDRKSTRAQGRELVEEAKRRLDAKREGYKDYLYWTRKPSRDRPTVAKRRAEKRAESDDEVRNSIDPELWPVWEKVKGRIKGSRFRSRLEAFEQWTHDHGGEVARIQTQAAELAGWGEESESDYFARTGNPRRRKSQGKWWRFVQVGGAGKILEQRIGFGTRKDAHATASRMARGRRVDTVSLDGPFKRKPKARAAA